MRIATLLTAIFFLSAGLASYAQAEDLDVLKGDKTLVAWVAPANLTQRAGGPLYLDNLAGDFDSITFAEITPGKWMAGSGWFKRTSREQGAWPEETAGPDTPVQIAVAYRGQQITIYRNGAVYAQYTMPGDAMEFGPGGVVTIGRQTFNPVGPHFAGRIDDVRVYNTALSAEQVAALKPNVASDPAPWAWWTFDDAKFKERTGKFETVIFGEPRCEDGFLVLDGKDDALIALRGAAGPGSLGPTPKPQEYAYVFAAGYGQADYFPQDPAQFEELIANMRKGGFNTILCTYTPQRLEICRKHRVKMMIDVLAWLKPVEQDVRRPEQQARVLEICRKVRGDDAVWGYNLWNERLDRYGPGGIPACNGLTFVLRKWDPTHPVWVGTYLTHLMGGIHTNPGCIAYYDYHWERGFRWNFHDLQAFRKVCDEKDAYMGRWMRNHDYGRSAYTMNTSIAFGLKTGIWFICGPWHPAKPTWNENDFLCKIGQDYQRSWPEIGKMGRPLEVYSTPTTKSQDNKDKPAGIPAGLAIPADCWFQVPSGEALVGHFRYDEAQDAMYVANHNAFASQKMAITFDSKQVSKVEQFNRATGQWQELDVAGKNAAFELGAGGGELLRISRRR